jgi:hypothetical protein
MPGTFIFAIITAPLALLCAAAWRVARSAMEAEAAKPKQPRSRYESDPEAVANAVRTGAKAATVTFGALTVLLVLISSCMTNVLEPLAKAGNVPVGFSCWPGGSVPGVIANATK